MTDHTATCVGCEQPFTFDIPDRLTAAMADTLRRVRQRCDACIEAADQADATEAAERQQVADQLELQRRLRLAGLPRRLPDEVDRDDSAAAQAARRFAAGEINCLTIIGPYGTGKTTIAAMALRHRLRQHAGYWRSVPQLITHLSYGFGHPDHDQALQLLSGRYMLGLDDIDKGRATGYVGQHVYAAVDGCYADDVPLIVTANNDLDALADHWSEHGGSIASRLAEGTVVVMNGPDRRLIHRGGS